MNKIKKIWMENRVLLVLGIILIVCIVIFLGVSLTYFYGSSNNVYGDRLDVIKKVPLSDKLFDDIKDKLKENASVHSVDIRLKGKIIYINIGFVSDTAMDDAKKVAESTIELFNEDELAVYDLQFSIKANGTNSYTLMGARNSNGSGSVIWNNYNIATPDTDGDDADKDKKDSNKGSVEN